MARRKGQVVTDMIDRTSSDLAELERKPSLEQLAVQLMDRAKDEGRESCGPGRLAGRVDQDGAGVGVGGELTEHLGYDPYDSAGHHSGNSRNGTRIEDCADRHRPDPARGA
jgi:hypothetical protein